MVRLRYEHGRLASVGRSMIAPDYSFLWSEPHGAPHGSLEMRIDWEDCLIGSSIAGQFGKATIVLLKSRYQFR